MGTINLKPDELCFSQMDEGLQKAHTESNISIVWTCHMKPAQKYWMNRTLFEIASALGTPPPN